LVALALILGTVASIGWSVAFDSQQGSDFGVYFRCGIYLQETLAENLKNCQSQYISIGDLYWRRSLFYTVPFGLIFQENYSLFKIYNVLLNTTAIAVVAWAVRKWAGPAAALVAVVLITLMHERVYMLTVATPDNLAILVTALALTALAFTQQSRISLLAACSLGISIVLLDYSRTTGLFVSLTAVLTSLALYAKGRSIAVVNVVVALAAANLIGILITPVIAGRAADGGFLMALSALNLASTQDFHTNFPWFEYFWPAIPLAERSQVGLVRLWQELASNGTLYPLYAFQKAQQISAGYGYTWFATSDFSDSMDTFITATTPTVPAVSPPRDWILRSALLPLLAFACAGAWRARPTPLAVAALTFVVVVSGILLLLSEAQPRYIIVLLPALAVLAGQAAAAPVQEMAGLRGHAKGLLIVAGALVLGGLGVLAARATAPLPLANAAGQVTAECSGARVESDGQRLVLHLPGAVACARATFKAPATPAVGMFLTDGVYPYRAQPRPANGIHIELKAKSGATMQEQLDRSHVIWRTLPVNPTGGDEIEVLARRPDGVVGDIKIIVAHVMPVPGQGQPERGRTGHIDITALAQTRVEW
jgi:hypothetical protein